MKRLARLGAIALLAAAMLAAAAEPKRRLEKVERELDAAKMQAGAIETQATGLLGEIEGLDRSIDASERRVAELAEAVRDEERKRVIAERAIAELDRELPRLRARLEARAVGLYRLSRRGLTLVLLQAPSDLATWQRNQRRFSTIVAADRTLFADIQRNRAAAEAARQAAGAAMQALAARRSENRGALADLRRQRDQKRELVASLREQGEKQTKLVDELGRAAGELQSLIEREDAKASLPAPPMAGSTRMLPPLAMRIESVAPARAGVEIRAPSGSVMQAVAAGRVVYADWLAGYGKVVILDHGEHLFSVYGYASELTVVPGTLVGAGEPIGKVGSTGATRTPMLYFEIRDHGVPREPSSYISALARK